MTPDPTLTPAGLGEAGAAVEQRPPALPARLGLPQDVPLAEQRPQPAGDAALAPRRPGGQDTVH